MSFANPAFLWAFLAIIPLAAIYLLKVRPTRKPTTAFFLWQDIFQEKKSTALFQRLRDLFSLLILLIAFSSIVLALAGPDFSGADRKDLVLLIDNSASMNAAEGGSTRLDEAKKVAAEIVKALNGNQRCSIASVSDRTRYVSNFSNNPRELLDAIDQIQPSSMVSNFNSLKEFRNQGDELEPSTDVTRNDGASESNHRVLLISDGCFADKIDADIELIKVGSRRVKNVGLVAVDMQRLPGAGNRVGVFFQVASSFEKTIEADLVISHQSEDNLIRIVPLQIKPGINPPDVFKIENAEEGSWYVRLETEDSDALADDNTAFLSLSPIRPIPVSVDTSDRYFYENSVLAFSRGSGILQLVQSGSDTKPQLRISQGVPSDPDSKTSILIFNPSGESPWWNQIGEQIEVNLPTVKNEQHAVVRHLDVSAISFAGAKRLSAPTGSEILVVAEDETPLIYQTTRSGQSAIVVNMDPVEAEFYFSTWFPVLVYSSAKHLQGRSEDPQSTYQTGQFASIPGAIGATNTEYQTPLGEVRKTREDMLGPLTETGFYQLENAAGKWLVSCSLLSSAETLLDDSESTDNHQPVDRGNSPAAWLTLLAIVLIVVESVLYHRRKVG